jgi:hypothetical protein
MAKCKKCGNKNDPKEAKFCSNCGTQTGGAATAVVVETTFENKCAVLSELWLSNRDDEQFTEFIEYNDIGLPLAYILENKIADLNDISENYINETFDLLLVLLEIEDQGFEDFDEVMSAAE